MDIPQKRIAAVHAALSPFNVYLSEAEVRAVIEASDRSAVEPIATCPENSHVEVYIPDGGIWCAFHTAGARATDVGATHWAWPRPTPQGTVAPMEGT
jgi:hypothetical protein